MRSLNCILFILVLFFNIACKKNAAKVDSNFVGTWNSFSPVIDNELNIKAKGRSSYRGEASSQLDAQKAIARIDKSENTLYIGQKKWQISKYPFQDTNGAWLMRLDGVLYYRR
jgi:hypothetical protein